MATQLAGKLFIKNIVEIYRTSYYKNTDMLGLVRSINLCEGTVVRAQKKEE